MAPGARLAIAVAALLFWLTLADAQAVELRHGETVATNVAVFSTSAL